MKPSDKGSVSCIQSRKLYDKNVMNPQISSLGLILVSFISIPNDDDDDDHHIQNADFIRREIK